MRWNHVCMCAMLASGLLCGCATGVGGKAAEAVKYTPVGAQMTLASKGLELAKAAGDQAGKAATTQAAQAEPRKSEQPSAGQSEPGAAVVKVSDPGADAKPETLLDQATAAVNQKDFDRATELLNKLEEMKSKLPQTLQERVTELRKSLDAAKAPQSAGTP